MGHKLDWEKNRRRAKGRAGAKVWAEKRAKRPNLKPSTVRAAKMGWSVKHRLEGGVCFMPDCSKPALRPGCLCECHASVVSDGEKIRYRVPKSPEMAIRIGRTIFRVQAAMAARNRRILGGPLDVKYRGGNFQLAKAIAARHRSEERDAEARTHWKPVNGPRARIKPE